MLQSLFLWEKFYGVNADFTFNKGKYGENNRSHITNWLQITITKFHYERLNHHNIILQSKQHTVSFLVSQHNVLTFHDKKCTMYIQRKRKTVKL